MRAERYPHVSLTDLNACASDVVVLPGESYPFSTADGPEVFPAAGWP